MTTAKRFKSLKEYVEYMDLGGYIERRKQLLKTTNTYGLRFEGSIIRALKKEYKVSKCTPEYDMIKGADIKFCYDNSSVLIDIKLNEPKVLSEDNTYFSKSFDATANKKDIKRFQISDRLSVFFAFRGIRQQPYGEVVLDKPTVIACFTCTDSIDENPITDKEARDIANCIKFVNAYLEHEGYPARDPRGFTYISK